MTTTPSLRPHSAHPFVYPLTFSGDSKVFAKLWWRNALLTVITLGIYFPWGRAAMLRYLARHTWLDGQHFDFHGVPTRMLRPTLICGLFLGLYVVASYLSPISGFIAALSFALLWPPIWRASIAFRLSQTSYGQAGLRVRYSGTLAEAYEHVGAPLVLFIFPVAWLGVDRSMFELHSTWTVVSTVALGLWLALFPAITWQLKRHLHSRLRLGRAQSELRLDWRTVMLAYTPMYALSALLLGAILGAKLLFGFEFVSDVSVGTFGNMVYYSGTRALWVCVGLAALVWLFVLRPMAMARQQRLHWGRTMDRQLGLRMRVNLDADEVFSLQSLNIVLIAATLGLYWPWARVNLLRLRIESTSVASSEPLQSVLVHASRGHKLDGLELSADMSTADIGL